MHSPTLSLHSFAASGILLACLPAVHARVRAGIDSSESAHIEKYSTVCYVDQATGDDVKGDGSVAKPFASIITALEAAGVPAAGKRVALLVSAGSYSQPTFVLKARVDLFGGFSRPGGERDVMRHRTILDGQERGRIAFGADDARVDGFYFVNARVRGKGAALLCDGTSPDIANCIFINNRTLAPVPWDPPLLHETANDGGAIMLLNGSHARIERCLFYDNTTECGRGGAVAADRAAAPRIIGCVFANNHSGLHDPMRSSDGGAVSFFDWSRGELRDSVIVANQALTRNDAGGVFVALWSSPRLAGNVFVANEAGDDAGGLFLGGQEHRYDAPLDAYPPAQAFDIIVDGNTIVGNTNSSRNSGAMRVTMETRARFTNNLVAENAGGFYLQRSEIVAEHNTIWQDWRFLEDKPTLGPSRIEGNIFKEAPAAVESKRVTISGNMAPEGTPGEKRQPVRDVFLDDGVRGRLLDLHFDPNTCTTTVRTEEPLEASDYAGRAVRMSDSATGGQWRVIASASGTRIVVWGRLDAVTKAPKFFEILRTFTPKPGSPAGLGARFQ